MGLVAGPVSGLKTMKNIDQASPIYFSDGVDNFIPSTEVGIRTAFHDTTSAGNARKAGPGCEFPKP